MKESKSSPYPTVVMAVFSSPTIPNTITSAITNPISPLTSFSTLMSLRSQPRGPLLPRLLFAVERRNGFPSVLGVAVASTPLRHQPCGPDPLTIPTFPTSTIVAASTASSRFASFCAWVLSSTASCVAWDLSGRIPPACLSLICESGFGDLVTNWLGDDDCRYKGGWTVFDPVGLVVYDTGGKFMRLRWEIWTETLEVLIDHVDYCLGRLSFISDGVECLDFPTILDRIATAHQRVMFNSEADLLCRLMSPIWCLLWICWFSPKGVEVSAVPTNHMLEATAETEIWAAFDNSDAELLRIV